MSAFRLIQKILTPLLFVRTVSQIKGRASLVKIKAAQLYVQGVQKTRILFLGIVLVMFAFVLLFSGLFLIHMGLLIYLPWDVNQLWIITCVLGVIEFSLAAALLAYLFSEKTWARFTEVSKILDYAVETKNKKGGRL